MVLRLHGQLYGYLAVNRLEKENFDLGTCFFPEQNPGRNDPGIVEKQGGTRGEQAGEVAETMVADFPLSVKQ